MGRKRKTKVSIATIIFCAFLASIAVLLTILVLAYLPVYIQVKYEEARTARIEAQAKLETARAAADVLRWRQKEDEREANHNRLLTWVAIGFPSILSSWVLRRMDRRTIKQGEQIEKLDEKTRVLMRQAK